MNPADRPGSFKKWFLRYYEQVFYNRLRYPRLVKHVGESRIFWSMQKDCYCLQMSNKMYTTLKDSRDSAQYKPADHRWRSLQLVQVSGRLKFVLMVISIPLPETSNSHKLLLLLTDRYSKLTRSLPTSKKMELHIASHFMNSWIISYGIPMHVFTDNKTQIVSASFPTLCPF